MLRAGPKLPQQKGCKGDQGPGCMGIGVTGRRERTAEAGQAGRLLVSVGCQAEVVRAPRTHSIKVRPGAQQVEECITRTVCAHELAVAEQRVVWPQESGTHRAPGEHVAHSAQRGLGWQLRGVVAHEGHAEAAGVLATCVRANPVPAAALVYVAV